MGPDGEVVLRNLPPIYVETLLSLPQILRDDSPDIRERLFPLSYPEHDDFEAEWDRFGRPDLESLFRSRTEIIEQDLEEFIVEPVWQGFRLEIPSAHKSAWVTGLNAARLMLGVKHGIAAEDMEKDLDFQEPDEKDLALLRVHLLGHVQGLILDLDQEGDEQA